MNVYDSDYMDDFMNIPAVTDARDRKLKLAKRQKEYRKYMDNKYRTQYAQSHIPKIILRNLPYQRREY